jgi:hypothetical protein
MNSKQSSKSCGKYGKLDSTWSIPTASGGHTMVRLSKLLIFRRPGCWKNVAGRDAEMSESIEIKTLADHRGHTLCYYARGHRDLVAFAAAVELYDETIAPAKRIYQGYMRSVPASLEQRDWTDTIALYPVKRGRGAYAITWYELGD